MCPGHNYGSYINFEDAKEACKKDSSCAAIYNSACTYYNFSLCSLGYTTNTTNNDCIYIKPGTVIIIIVNFLVREFTRLGARLFVIVLSGVLHM